MDAMGGFVAILLMLAVAIAAASITLTRARIFKPARDWAQEKNFLLFKLISCPYCLSHWFAAFLAPYVMYGVVDSVFVNWLISTFTLVGLSALLEGLMMNWLHMQENYIQDLEQQYADLRKRTVLEQVEIPPLY